MYCIPEKQDVQRSAALLDAVHCPVANLKKPLLTSLLTASSVATSLKL